MLKLVVFPRADCVNACENMAKKNTNTFLKMVHTLHFEIDQAFCHDAPLSLSSRDLDTINVTVILLIVMY